MTQAAAAAFLMLVLLFGGPWVTVQSTGAPEPQPARTAQELEATGCWADLA